MPRSARTASSIPNAIEESLRFDSPVQLLARTCTEKIDVDGVSVAKGDRVLYSIASANRDERFFSDPGEFRLDRPRPRDHVAFGAGPHVCPGAFLARMEAKVALETLLDRVERIELAPGYVFDPNPVFWALGPRTLRVRLIATQPTADRRSIEIAAKPTERLPGSRRPPPRRQRLPRAGWTDRLGDEQGRRDRARPLPRREGAREPPRDHGRCRRRPGDRDPGPRLSPPARHPRYPGRERPDRPLPRSIARTFPAAVGIVEPAYGDASFAELERCKHELGLAGISFHTRFQGVSLDSRFILAYVAKMAELGLLPVIHAMNETPEEALWKLAVARALDSRHGGPRPRRLRLLRGDPRVFLHRRGRAQHLLRHEPVLQLRLHRGFRPPVRRRARRLRDRPLLASGRQADQPSAAADQGVGALARAEDGDPVGECAAVVRRRLSDSAQPQAFRSSPRRLPRRRDSSLPSPPPHISRGPIGCSGNARPRPRP